MIRFWFYVSVNYCRSFAVCRREMAGMRHNDLVAVATTLSILANPSLVLPAKRRFHPRGATSTRRLAGQQTSTALDSSVLRYLRC